MRPTVIVRVVVLLAYLMGPVSGLLITKVIN
jgi:hypothetical protein